MVAVVATGFAAAAAALGFWRLGRGGAAERGERRERVAFIASKR